VNPSSRLKWTLIAALLMWAPAALSVVGGHLDLLNAGLAFLAGLAIAYLGVSIISHLIENYQHTQHMVMRARRQIEDLERRRAEEEASPNRRADDA